MRKKYIILLQVIIILLGSNSLFAKISKVNLLIKKAMINNENGLFDEAIKNFLLVADVDSKSTIPAYIHIAKIYQKTGRYDLAVQFYKKVLAIKKHPDIKHEIAILYLRFLNKPKKAYPLFSELISIRPTEKVLTDFSVCCYKLKLFSECKKNFEYALKKFPYSPIVKSRYAYYLAISDNLEFRNLLKASQLIENTILYTPLSINYEILALIKAEQNDFKNAVFYIKLALDLYYTEFYINTDKEYCKELKTSLSKYQENEKLPKEMKDTFIMSVIK